MRIYPTTPAGKCSRAWLLPVARTMWPQHDFVRLRPTSMWLCLLLDCILHELSAVDMPEAATTRHRARARPSVSARLRHELGITHSETHAY